MMTCDSVVISINLAKRITRIYANTHRGIYLLSVTTSEGSCISQYTSVSLYVRFSLYIYICTHVRIQIDSNRLITRIQ
ncbi:hypothetical protein CSUI_005703 [Cystoisospora suis]|uniref:Uncharacterized protein n=1 Tax=Cystoisospora suis TaxID=483139 RepID=A0A2C6K4I6_9APIC|nr:hypothetical protein CSUI_005703 [Cystoisospora suis]